MLYVLNKLILLWHYYNIYSQECIPTLIDFASCDKAGSRMQLASLQALTNLSVTAQYHQPYTQLIQHLYDLLDSGIPSHCLQALKILVNLSSNLQMVPHLLAARVGISYTPFIRHIVCSQLVFIRGTIIFALSPFIV